MKRSTHYPQPFVRELGAYAIRLDRELPLLGVSSELNRLLTAAVVNRRFCRLLLTNPLGALTHGYRGESFRLNPIEIRRVSAIRATSLRDFALQLLVNDEVEDAEETLYAKERQEVTLFVR